MTGRCAIAAMMVVALGCQGGNDGPDISGRWAMFAFEDPVAVDLKQTGDVLSGRGCCSGLGADAYPELDCCGAVTGEIAGRHASFGFTFDLNLSEPYVYATEANVSVDGRRMTGTFSRTGSPVAWVRLGAGENFLPEPDQAFIDVMYARGGGYTLAVSDAPAGGADFSAQEMYRFYVYYRYVFGALGSYLSSEMTWNAHEQTLLVGPVPETDPGLPVQLRLHFDGNTLTSVEATMGSGLRYTFQAVASQQ